MSKSILIGLLVVGLAACGGDAPAPVEGAAPAPQPELTAEPVSEVKAVEADNG